MDKAFTVGRIVWEKLLYVAKIIILFVTGDKLSDEQVDKRSKIVAFIILGVVTLAIPGVSKMLAFILQFSLILLLISGVVHFARKRTAKVKERLRGKEVRE